jgi:uncharacterized membrane protein
MASTRRAPLTAPVRRARVRPGLASSGTGRLILGLGAVLIGATVVGLVALWPVADAVKPPPGSVPGSTLRADVVAVRVTPCEMPGQEGCRVARARLQEGSETGRVVEFRADSAGRNELVEVADAVRLTKNAVPPGADASKIAPYAFSGFERRAPLLWLALGFVAIVVAFGRWRGVRSLVGLAISLLVVAEFVVPAIIGGRDPVAVAVVGAMAIMLTTIVFAHGAGAKSLAAILGTTFSLGLTVVLASVFTGLTELSGMASDQSVLLVVGQDQVSLRGLVLAGMIIGALGVLDDVTVSQASAVMALRAADPTQGARALYQGALSVGRDHVAATVNTLVLAYVGAALPTVLLFSVAGTSFGEVVNNESVAQEIVATLVGSIGLIAAVPVTTALAAAFARSLPVDGARSAAHLHAH